jgi:hypothetical protein
MSLFLGVLIGLLAIVVSQDPGGKLWRELVAAPARILDRLTWRKILVIAIVVAIAAFATEFLVADMAWILAADVVAWIDIFAATLIVTRLLPGWRALKALVTRGVQAAFRARPRSPRARRIRRPSATPDDVDPAPAFGGWAIA